MQKIEENKGQHGKTPDFLLCKDSLEFAVCEVKEMTDDVNDGTWEKRDEDGLQSYEKENSPAVAKVSKKIKEGYEQLRSYKLSKVLVFIDYYSDHVSSLNHVLKSFQDGNIGEIKNKIDLYIWIDKGSVGKEDELYFRGNSVGKQLKQNYFR